jgi:hypothetical protein
MSNSSAEDELERSGRQPDRTRDFRGPEPAQRITFQ